MPGRIYEIVFVEDMARYGLHLHLGAEVEKIALDPLPPRHGYAAPNYDQDLASELAEREPDVVWIAKREHWTELEGRVAALGYRTQPLGADYRGRVIFRVFPRARTPAPNPAPATAG